MKYKLIMSDLDGTLLDDDMNIAKPNIKAIHDANQKGIKFVMASGRVKPLIDRYIKELSLDESENYVVCSNGSCIYETKNNSLIYEKRLDLQYVQHIIKEAKKFQVYIHLYENDCVHTNNLTEIERELLISSGMKFYDYDENKIDSLPITKIILVGYNNELLKVQRHFAPYVLGKINMMFSSTYYLEFFNLYADKGYALKFLTEKLSIGADEAIAVGDNYNDMGMIKTAGLGLAPANAVDEIKVSANYVLNSTNNDGVFKEIMKRFVNNAP